MYSNHEPDIFTKAFERELPRHKYRYTLGIKHWLVVSVLRGIVAISKTAYPAASVGDRLTIPAMLFLCAQMITADNGSIHTHAQYANKQLAMTSSFHHQRLPQDPLHPYRTKSTAILPYVTDDKSMLIASRSGQKELTL